MIKRIKGTHYYASTDGRIYRIEKGAYIEVKALKRGKKLSVSLNMNGERTSFNIDTLIARTFLGIPDKKRTCIIHKNGNLFDNRVENLCYREKCDLFEKTYQIDEKPLHEPKKEHLEYATREQIRLLKESIENLKTECTKKDIRIQSLLSFNARLQDELEKEKNKGFFARLFRK